MSKQRFWLLSIFISLTILLGNLQNCVDSDNDVKNVETNGSEKQKSSGKKGQKQIRADFNGDGVSDIFWRNEATGENTIWKVMLDGNKKLYPQGEAGLEWKVLGLGDFNGDKTTDVLWRDKNSGSVYVWLMGNYAIVNEGEVSPLDDKSWKVGGIGDFNKDGKSDILWRHETNGQNAIWFMKGVTMKSSDYIEEVADLDWEIKSVNNFGGDRSADILWRHRTTGEVYIWIMNGLVKKKHGSVETLADFDWEIIDSGDFDGDKKSDIIWQNKQTGQCAIWYMNGIKKTSGEYLETVEDLGWEAKQLGHFNKDDRLDILWRHSSTGEVYYWTMSGSKKTKAYSGGFVEDLDWKIKGTPRLTESQSELEYEDSHFGIFAFFVSEEFDQLWDAEGWSEASQYWDWAEGHIPTLGVHWTRSNLNLIWNDIEDESGQYNWNKKPRYTENMLQRIYKPENQMHWLAVIGRPSTEERESDDKDKPPMRNGLDEPEEYKEFIKATVERFDGDGIDDFDPNIKIKYWQVGNEISSHEDPEVADSDYVDLVILTKEAILAADSEAKIVIVADLSGNGNTVPDHHKNILTELGKKDPTAIHAIDIHHWGAAGLWKMKMIPAYQELFKSLNMEHVKIWSGEHGTWEGKPGEYPLQSEEEQASSLIKRYVYNLNNGVDKIFWNNLMDWHNFGGNPDSIYNSLGLITDSKSSGEVKNRFNKPRISYWCYAALSKLIDAHRAEPLGPISDLEPATDVWGYAYKLKSTNKEFYILWAAEEGTRVSFEAASHVKTRQNMIPDNTGKYKGSQSLSTGGKKLSFVIGSDPVLISDMDITAIP